LIEADTGTVRVGPDVLIPPLKAFMDDTTVIANSADTASKTLSRLDSVINWCRMKFKPTKSRSLSLKKGILDNHVKFRIGGQVIPTVAEEPVKSLGRWYTCSLKDTEQGKQIRQVADNGLNTIGKTQLQGKFKVWIVQFMLIPKLLWPLLIYEIGLSTVEAIERRISSCTRKWLGLPPGLTTVALYSKNAKLRLPLKSVVEEFKTGKARLQMMLKYSPDSAISSIEPALRTGRKWKVGEACEQAEESAKLKEVLGATQCGRQGLGYGTEKRQWWSKASGKEKRDLVIHEVREIAEQERVQCAVQQSQQGQWTTWEDVLQRSLSWNDIWHIAPLRLSFVIRAVYDQLPTGANLAKWKLTQDDKCPLCGGVETLNHVLSACTVALSSGRYTWRHNQVLKKLVEALDESRRKANARTATCQTQKRWMRSGGAIASRNLPARVSTENLLDSGNDWMMAADMPGMKVYPEVITKTNLRPDAVLISEASRTVVLVELTVPYETNMNESHEYKAAKYEGLVQEIRQAGYRPHLFPVEIGARGMAGASAYSLLKRLGLPNQVRSRYLKQLAEAAERASCWIWSKRKIKEWNSAYKES
jgi:hypothetical protein